jgi:hypothetical protein
MDIKELTGMVYAFCMGDGGIFYTNKTARNPVFIANNIVDNRDYVEYRADVLRGLTKVRVYEIDQSHREGHRNLLRTVTNSHPIYTKVHNRLYVENKKVIDPHQLTFMSWQFLAILYMDDGSVNVDKRCKNATPAVSIHTKSFSYGDNVLLKKAIEDKLGLYFKVTPHNMKGKRYWYLRLSTKQYLTFRDGVAPYILPSFEYKIPSYYPNG